MPGAPDGLREGAEVGHFRLEKMIGRGGMGVVWAAKDTRDEKRVALKFLDDVRRDDPVSHARFLREAELATKLRHPNVVRVHAIDYTLEGAPFLVMDLLEGDSLRARMKVAQRLSPKECGVLLTPVASAARAAHEAGIVHRDLKPENVFVSSEGVRVLDFGIAKRLSADEVQDTFTSTGAMLGTPAYMAPEQIFGERDIDGKVDVWALGVITYECLSGVRPTEGGPGQILKAVTSNRIVPLGERVAAPELAGFCRFVMSMLAKEPVDRPPMAEVERVLAGLRDDAHDEVAAAATGSSKPSNALAWTVVAIVLATGTAAIVRFTAKRETLQAPAASASASASETAPPPIVTAEPSREIAAPSASVMVTTTTTTMRPTPRAPMIAAPVSTSTGQPIAAEYDVALGRVGGMGNQPTQSDVVAAMHAMKPCFPTPTTDEKWTVALDVTWPKGGARTESFGARRNGASSANAQLEACAKKTFDAARIAVPDGQDEASGTSYVRMSVGYY